MNLFDRSSLSDALILRDYQDESVERLRDNIRKGVKNQILCAPTGAGKTAIATYLLNECHAKGHRAVFVVDRIALINQTVAMLDKYGVPCGVIQAKHPRTDPSKLIQVASVQTLLHRNWPKASLIIVDEAHTITKTVAKRIEPRDTICIGLTATPFAKGLAKLYDAVVSVTTTNKLTDQGHLVPFDAWAAAAPDMTGAKVVAGEWTDDECSQRAMPIVGNAVAEYIKWGGDTKFIAFGCDVRHCEELARQFNLAGINTALYTYQTGDTERALTLAEFSKPDSSIRGLVSVAALSKGFDRPDVGTIIMCRPLRKSLSEFIQSLGRGLRPHPGKERLRLLDLAGNTQRFWNAMHEFFEESVTELDDGKHKEGKKQEKKERVPKKCPMCACVHDPRPFCPACGHEYPKRPTVEHESGELVAIGGGTVPKDTKQAWYSQFLAYAKDRGYKEGWAAWTYKTKFGVWPRGLEHVTLPPTPEVANYIRSRLIARAKALHPVRKLA